MSHTNIVSKLHQMASKHPDRIALVMGDNTLSFSQLSVKTKQVAGRIKHMGIQPGDRVVVMVPMSLDLYVVMMAVIQIGAVCVFFDPWFDKQSIARIVDSVNPVAYIGHWKAQFLRLSHARLRKIPISINVGKRWLAQHGLQSSQSSWPLDAIYPVQEDSPALVTYSSGSSGLPKGANRTHGFLLAQHEALKQSFPDPGQVNMNMFPIFALNNLGCGITSVIPKMDFRRVDRICVDTILQQMKEHSVTSVTASPPFFDQLSTQVLPSIRQIITGGGPVTNKQLRGWQTTFVNAKIIIAYGSTEAEPVAHIDVNERLQLAGGDNAGYCMGRPIEQVRAKLIKITDCPIALASSSLSEWEVAPGAIGELIVSGAHVCKNYYHNAYATHANKINDGERIWHRMGDTGYFDTQGRFWLVGRVHSTLQHQGQTIHPQHVEQVILDQFPEVSQVAIVKVKHQLVLVVDAGDEQCLQDALAERGINVQVVHRYKKRFPVDPRHNTKVDVRKLTTILEATL